MARGVLEGSLLWTEDGPRPVEAIVPGAPLVAFDPDAFRRTTLVLERVERSDASETIEFLAGGRWLAVAQRQPLLTFDIMGEWSSCTAGTLGEGALVPVDRQVPFPRAPVTLPPIDAALTASLAENPLTLADSIYQREKYYEEMDKRARRLTLFELSGYLLAIAELLDGALLLARRESDATGYYSNLCSDLFGHPLPPEGVSGEEARRIALWLGEGLDAPAARRLPRWALRLENQSRSALLRGVFDALSTVSEEEVALRHPSVSLLVGLQALLGSLGVESDVSRTGTRDAPYTLRVRNVRRFAEWISSNVRSKEGVLRVVYSREPRYPSKSEARLPLNKVRPLLERIRATHRLERRTDEHVEERDAARVPTLRLLATAFHEPSLRLLVNQQVYLEPVTSVRCRRGGPVLAPVTSVPGYIVVNGVILAAGGA